MQRIRLEFIGNPESSLTRLAEAHGISRSALDSACTRGQWRQARKAYSQRVACEVNAAVGPKAEETSVAASSLNAEHAPAATEDPAWTVFKRNAGGFLSQSSTLLGSMLSDAEMLRPAAASCCESFKDHALAVGSLIRSGKELYFADSPGANGGVNLACQIVVGSLEAEAGLLSDLAEVGHTEPNQHQHQGGAAAIDLDAAEEPDPAE